MDSDDIEGIQVPGDELNDLDIASVSGGGIAPPEYDMPNEDRGNHLGSSPPGGNGGGSPPPNTPDK